MIATVSLWIGSWSLEIISCLITMIYSTEDFNIVFCPEIISEAVTPYFASIPIISCEKLTNCGISRVMF